MSAERQDAAWIDPSLVGCLAVALPEVTSLAGVTPALVELVESATIRILDLVVVTRRRRDHGIDVLGPAALESLPPRLLASRQLHGLVSENDITLAASGLLPGAVALVLLVEDRWAGPLSAAAKGAGGFVLGGERVAPARMEAALFDRPTEPTPLRAAPQASADPPAHEADDH